jgi:hypothetical protein
VPKKLKPDALVKACDGLDEAHLKSAEEKPSRYE